MKPTYSIKTLGCKLNQYESSLIAQQFSDCGWEARPFGQIVDVVIVNTCTVTDRSDKKCRNYIRQAAKFSKTGKAVVTGCLVERDRRGVALMPEVLAVFGNDDKRSMVSKLRAYMDYVAESADEAEDAEDMDDKDFGDAVSAGFAAYDDDEAGFFGGYAMPLNHTRGYLKIQDGCDGQCAYCIVPSVRGAPVSRDVNDVVEHAARLIAAGIPELILTGITIGKYMSRDVDLAGLAGRIAGLDGGFRLRITSIEPLHVTDGLIALFGSGRVCPHIHLSLQSGSDRVLERMNRPYRMDEYFRIVERLRNRCPDIAIGTDVIVGFPGEGDDDFRETLWAVERAGFAYVHQFSFSTRTGTPAAALNGMCSERELSRRSAELRAVAAGASLRYRQRFEGKILPCVIEKNRGDERYTAVSGNYLKIRLAESPLNKEMMGGITGVRVLNAGREGVEGTIAGNDVFCD